MTHMPMADAEHNSVRRRKALLIEKALPIEGEMLETDAAETDATPNPRPKPLNADTTTAQPRIFYFSVPGRVLGFVLNNYVTKLLPRGFLLETTACKPELNIFLFRNISERCVQVESSGSDSTLDHLVRR